MKKNFDGKIYIKGDFFSTNTNLTTKHIIKLNFDGTLDSNFNFYEEVGGFRVTDDNKIIAFGASQIFRNGSQYKIIRFNSDSSVDNTFVSPSFNFIPTYIELVDNNKITVSFGTNTINNSHIIRLNENGSADLITNLVNNPPIFKTKTINDKVYLSSYSSATNSGYLFRYNNDWTVDTSFTQIETPNTSIYLSLSNDRTVTKTNQNDPISGNSTIYRINNSNGILTSSLFLPNETNILMSQNCENIIVCGNFNKVNGFNKHNIYRLSVPSLTITTTPTGEISQLFTQGQTLADLIVNGQNIQWYDSQNQCAFNTLGRNSNQLNSFLPSNTLLVDGTTYYASQTINGFESNHRLPITVYQPLGVNELSLINLKLYPNPIKNNLTISNNLNIDKIELFNLIGQKILEKSLLKNEINLDFTSYNKGIYLLKIFSEGKVQTNKIIKE